MNRLIIVNSLLILTILFSCKKDPDLTVNSLQELEHKISEEMELQNLTSVSYAVVKNNQLLHSGAKGYANEEQAVLATDSTRYLVASVSKTITAVALMQLVDDGLISLDEDINSFLPYSVRNPDYPSTKITFRMLLTHTSSISDDFQNTLNLDCFGSDCSLSLSDFFSEVFTSNGAYYSDNNYSTKAPGTKEDYSNLASALVGYLVERISETPFDEYCSTHIFNPLNMKKTSWRLSDSPLDELAIPYSSEITSGNPHYTFPDYPNGGLRTTALDLSKFLRAIILNGTFEEVEILSEQSAQAMKQLQFGSESQCLSFYYELINDEEYLGHSGGEKGVTAEMYFNPTTNVGVLAFSNEEDAPLDNIVSLLFNYGELD